jgi:hypothetical protein
MPPDQALPSVHCHRHLSSPAPTPASTGALRPICCPTPPQHSPDIRPPRPTTPCSAAQPRRHRHSPNSGRESTEGEPLGLPHLFHGRPRRQSHRISSEPPPYMAQGPNCIPLFLPRVFCANQELSCEPQKVSKGLFESSFLNSECIIAYHGKSTENQRKIRKMQTQICWIICEKHYNFCKA